MSNFQRSARFHDAHLPGTLFDMADGLYCILNLFIANTLWAATEHRLAPTSPDLHVIRLNEDNTNKSSKWSPPLTQTHTADQQGYISVDQKPQFDIPMTYNRTVSKWIRYFQGAGRKWFSTYLSRSYRYIPHMQEILRERGLPQDLAYISMIESGFSPHAVSTANAVGYWQFLDTTGERYGLRTDWWLDERKDYLRSTEAAAKYLADLYKIFDSWYLTACAYNMGENRLKRLVKKYETRNFWQLSKSRDFPDETREYIPKLIAAVLIAKVPRLYGFGDVSPSSPLRYEVTYAPGGTDLVNLAKFIGSDSKALVQLNPALVQGFIPKTERGYWIRIPKGHTRRVANYLKKQAVAVE